MSVREATILDLLPLTVLAEAYAEEAQGHDLFPLDIEFALQNATLSIMSDDGVILLAFDANKQMVGFLWGNARALPWSKAKLAFDSILYVRPEFRGSKAAFELLTGWHQWADSQGCASSQISIASGIHEAKTVRFFKRMGYSYIGQQFRKECKQHGIDT